MKITQVHYHIENVLIFSKKINIGAVSFARALSLSRVTCAVASYTKKEKKRDNEKRQN